MTSKKYFYILSATFVLLVGLIIAGFMQGNALLEKKSMKLKELKVEISAIEMQQIALAQAKKDVEKYSDLEKVVKTVVPQDKDQAKTVREIVQIAADNKIPLESITFESSSLGDAKAPTSTGGTSGGTKTTMKQPTDGQLKAIEGINGVFSLPIQIQSGGEVSYQNFLNFLNDLEQNRRTAHVDAITVNPTKSGSTLEFSLTLNAYVKPQS